MSASATTQVIIMYIDKNLYVCAHLQQVCVLRACPPKPNVHNACIAFDPCMCVCQSSTQALCGVDNNPNMCHLRICLNRFQPNSTSYVYDKLVCMSLMYVHDSIAFTPLACVYTSIVNQSLCGIDNNLNISSHIIQHLYWHVHTCQHQLQPQSTSCVYKYMHISTTKSLSTKASMVKYMSAFVPSTLQLMHVYTSIVNTMSCRQ